MGYFTPILHTSNLGVTAVPTMVFNDSMTMNGAYPVDSYKQVLTELLEQKGEQNEKTNC